MNTVTPPVTWFAAVLATFYRDMAYAIYFLTHRDLWPKPPVIGGDGRVVQ